VLHILVATFPFFALVGCGYLAVHRNWLPQAAIPGLNGFVLYFALPCLLYRFGATTPIGSSLDPSVMGVHLLTALLMVGAVVLWSRRRGIDWNNTAFGALVGTFPNTGYMGVPLLVALLGAPAAGPAIATILIDLIITSSLCIALSQLASAEAHGARTAARNALGGVLANPMPWAIIAGAAASAIGFALPTPVDETVGLMADAASPVALFTIGAVLARSTSTGSRLEPLWDTVPVALMKLLLHPILLWLVGTGAMRVGVPLDPFALTVMVLVAALPSASNVAMLSERFNADSGRIARIILVSTTLAFLTFSGAVALLL
jgi:malonate transporter and related proteins